MTTHSIVYGLCILDTVVSLLVIGDCDLHCVTVDPHVCFPESNYLNTEGKLFGQLWPVW